MTLETLRRFFMWCSVFNYGMLLLWASLSIYWRQGFYRLCSRLYGISLEQFDMLNFGGMSVYKILIILFNLVPWVALWLV